MHENEPVDGTRFHMNGFARRLVLTQRQKAARKWPIETRLAVWTEGVREPSVISKITLCGRSGMFGKITD